MSRLSDMPAGPTGCRARLRGPGHGLHQAFRERRGLGAGTAQFQPAWATGSWRAGSAAPTGFKDVCGSVLYSVLFYK